MALYTKRASKKFGEQNHRECEFERKYSIAVVEENNCQHVRQMTSNRARTLQMLQYLSKGA